MKFLNLSHYFMKQQKGEKYKEKSEKLIINH